MIAWIVFAVAVLVLLGAFVRAVLRALGDVLEAIEDMSGDWYS